MKKAGYDLRIGRLLRKFPIFCTTGRHLLPVTDQRRTDQVAGKLLLRECVPILSLASANGCTGQI